MITLNLDWHEVLWWLQGGMSGSHLRWGVYEDMINLVWPQCSEQEREAIFTIMRRDLGYWWRPDGWRENPAAKPLGADEAAGALGAKLGATASWEGEWKDEEKIFDKEPWLRFRKVMACFCPDNQYKVTMRVNDANALRSAGMFRARIVEDKNPAAKPLGAKGAGVPSVEAEGTWAVVPAAKPLGAKGAAKPLGAKGAAKPLGTVAVRAYLWEGCYMVDYNTRCGEEFIVKVEKMELER